MYHRVVGNVEQTPNMPLLYFQDGHLGQRKDVNKFLNLIRQISYCISTIFNTQKLQKLFTSPVLTVFYFQGKRQNAFTFFVFRIGVSTSFPNGDGAEKTIINIDKNKPGNLCYIDHYRCLRTRTTVCIHFIFCLRHSSEPVSVYQC